MYLQDPRFPEYVNPFFPQAAPVNPYLPQAHTLGANWFTPKLFQPLPPYLPTMSVPPIFSQLLPQNPFIVPNFPAVVPPIYGQLPPATFFPMTFPTPYSMLPLPAPRF